MTDNGPYLIRKLNARERRRLVVHRMLPIDAIDPTCSTRELIEHHNTNVLYRYGCSLTEANLEVENDRSSGAKKRSFLCSLRGFRFSFQCRQVSRFTFINFYFSHSLDIHRSDRTRIHWRRSLMSSNEDSLDELSFIFEPIFVVGYD